MRLAVVMPLLAFGLAGCTAVPDLSRPVSLPADYASAYRPPLRDDRLWWHGFQDQALNQLVARALTSSLEIEAARSRFAAAAALVQAERGDRLPSLAAEGEVIVARDPDGDTGSDIALGASGLFDPDISGRLSAEIAAAAARASAAEYLIADVQRLVAAEVVRQYVELRRTEARLALLEQSTEIQQQTLRIVQLRFEAGLSANLDVRRAAADLAQTRAQRGLLELARARAAHALAILTGEAPRASLLPDRASSVPSYAGGPPRGVPADLLRRRPDLLVAEAELLEAAARVGVERSDLLPSLRIPGQIAVGDGSFGGIFSALFATIGATLNLPVFDGGRRRAEVRAAEAEADARFADYRQSVLAVLAEVENALVAIDSYAERITDLRSAIEQSEAAFSQSNALYREGLTTLFDVLDAQRQLIDSREALIDSNAELAAAVVALHAAVGAATSEP